MRLVERINENKSDEHRRSASVCRPFLRNGRCTKRPDIPLALLVTIAALSVVPTRAMVQPARLAEMLDSYLRGDYDDALTQAAAIENLGAFRVRYVQEAPTWVASEPAAIERRRAAAASFLLELTHERLESDWGRLHDLIEFMCLDLRSGNPAPSFERAFHRASIALAGRARARLWLLGEYAVLPHQPPRQPSPSQKPDANPKHLMHALERHPADPHLQLARVVAWTWGRDHEPIRNGRDFNDSTPPLMTRRTTPQREAITALRPLVDDPLVGAEARMRVGLMYLSIGDYDAARGSLEQAAREARDVHVRYLSHFSAGRALEQLKRPDEARDSYVAALEVIAGAESATVALASLLFVHADRGRALALMRDAFAQPTVNVDPGRLAGYGEYMHWPELRATLRAEVAR